MRPLPCHLALAIALAMAGCAHRAPASAPAGDAQVRATLLAGSSRVVPGQPLSVAVLFRITRGWHIYWENPGESGLPTAAVLSAPPGFQVGPSRYPGPERFISPGPILGYGYEGETAIFFQVTPPARLTLKEVPIAARARWLACSEVCVPGSAELSVTLPTGARARPVHEEVLARHRANLPRSIESLGEVRIEGDMERLVIEVAGVEELDLFPGPGLAVTEQELTRAAGRLLLTISLRREAGGTGHWGVLRAARSGRRTFHALSLTAAKNGGTPP